MDRLFGRLKMNLFELKNKKGIKAYGIVFFFDLLNKFIAGVNGIIIVRMLTSQEYANFTVFNSIASVISGMIGSGISMAFLRLSVKDRSMNKNDDSGYYTFCIFMNWALLLSLFFFYKIIAGVYKTSSLIAILGIMEAAILSQGQLNLYVYQAREDFFGGGKIYSLRNLLIFLSLVFALLLCKKLSDKTVMISIVFAGCVVLGASFFLLRKLKDFKFPNWKIETEKIEKLFFEIKWLILYFVLLSFINAVDVIMLNKFSSSYNVANYGVAFKYYSLFLTLLPSILAVLRVKCSTNEFEESSKKRITFMKIWIKKTGIITLVVMLIVPIVSYCFWHFLNGDGYQLAYNCFIIFLFGAMLSYIFSPAVNFMLSANMHKQLCIIVFCALLFNIIGNYIMVNKCGALGVTIITVISQAMLNCGSTIILFINDKGLMINN